MSTIEMILEELRTLPPPKLEVAASYIHRFEETVRTERVLGWERTAGTKGFRVIATLGFSEWTGFGLTRTRRSSRCIKT